MQIKGKKKLKNISLSEIMIELIKQYGGKAAVCRKLGFEGKDVIKKESVKLAHYEKGESRPKGEFIELWKKVFGDDLLALERERNVSRGTNSKQNITLVGKGLLKPKEPTTEYMELLKDNLIKADKIIAAQEEKIEGLKKDLEDCRQGRK